MAKNPASANQDYYKVGGSSPFPDRHQVEVDKRNAKAKAPAAKTAKPEPASKKPGKKGHPNH